MTLIKITGIKNPKIIFFERDDIMIKALRLGNIDVALVDGPTAHYWNINSSGTLVALGEPMTFGAGIGIAINQGNFQLLSVLNPALLDYQNSPAFKEDYHKYLIHFSAQKSP
ncbi:type 2 periplasmic-binding domain-containing protein [Legionella tunisiensis]|uniref:transporter substrate-binding domain-containing protein n=1 Tax=Legionella tunisiensis TaxID=1034944 RepID=UPI000474DE2C|nr:transporter substrate-binding domain-containing protein [Legionella tunisiensis]